VPLCVDPPDSCCAAVPAANVYAPEAGNEEVYNGSGCREIVESVLGGCNGESIHMAAAAKQLQQKHDPLKCKQGSAFLLQVA
jgi:hypothetical protein